MSSRYWVGGSDNWNGTAGSKWALTSGGTGGEAEPTASDDVFFDSGSGVVTVTIATSTRPCLSLNFNTFAGVFTGSTNLTISGSLTLSAGMTISGYTGTITFNSTSSGNTIAFNGNSLSSANGGLVFNGVAGVWTLQDNLSATNFQCTLTNGTLNTNGKTLTTSNFQSNNSNTRVLTITNSTWNVSAWSINSATGLTFNSSGSQINVTSSSTFAPVGGTITYNNVKITPGGATVNISGTAVFNTLELSSTIAKTFQFQATSTQTVTTFICSGTAGNIKTLKSITDTSAWTISKSSGTVSLDYLSIRDSAAAGGAAWYAGANSTSVSGNSGWIFTAPPAGPTNMKSYNTNLSANIKSIDTNPIANIKSFDTNS